MMRRRSAGNSCANSCAKLADDDISNRQKRIRIIGLALRGESLRDLEVQFSKIKEALSVTCGGAGGLRGPQRELRGPGGVAAVNGASPGLCTAKLRQMFQDGRRHSAQRCHHPVPNSATLKKPRPLPPMRTFTLDSSCIDAINEGRAEVKFIRMLADAH